MTASPVLLLVNGPPAVGKSTVARRYVEDHPLSLLVEIDGLRAALGRWEESEQSRHLARTLAVALVGTHLQQGHDVVVPQFLGRADFVEGLGAVASRCHAVFVEVMLRDDGPGVAARFRARRDDLARAEQRHPEGDVDLDDLDRYLAECMSRLDELVQVRPRTAVVPFGDGPDAAYDAIVAVVADARASASGDSKGTLRWNAVTLDCREAGLLAAFYAGLLGWEVTARDHDWCQLADPDGGVGLNLQSEPRYEAPVWPEQPGEQAKMIHLEMQVDDIEAAVEQARGLGAREAHHQPLDRDPAKLRVMLDPAGHPFCLWTD